MSSLPAVMQPLKFAVHYARWMISVTFFLIGTFLWLLSLTWWLGFGFAVVYFLTYDWLGEGLRWLVSLAAVIPAIVLWGYVHRWVRVDRISDWWHWVALDVLAPRD